MFSNLKKEKKKEKISSGRVQVLGSSFRDPWDSFVVRPLTYSLKSYPRELIKSNSLSSQHCPFFVLCGLFVTEWTQNHASILSAKGECEPSHIRISHSSRLRCLLYSPHFLLLSSWNQNFKWLTLAQICFSCRDSIISSCFFTWKPFKALDDTPSNPKDADRWSWKKQSSVCLKTKKFQDFYLVLSTFQMLSSVVDFRDGLLFFWIGNQASFLLECKNNSWNNCWGHF